MTPNQARLIRFHLGFTGWQTYGPQSRAAAVTLADWGILERGGDNGRQFRLALSADDRRALDAAPAMLAALQGMVRGYREAFGDAIESDGREGGAFSEYFAAVDAIAAATGAPTDETGAAAPTGEIEYLAFCQQSDGRGTIWIEHVSGATVEAAIQEAREACADAWGYDVDSVHCLGLIEGKATVAHWQDSCDVFAATGER